MINKKHQQGITLLEIMLVIVIIGTILYLSVQQYLGYRASADAYQVRSNVDVIFEAMNAYYKRNCYGETSNNPAVPARWGTLNPKSPTNPLANPNYPIDLDQDLRANGFLSLTIPSNSIIDNAPGLGTSGYVLQFNLTQTPRNICTQPVKEGSPVVSLATSGNCAQSADTMGTIISWQAQVAVKIKDTKYATTYMREMGGDCLSTASGTFVLPCSANQPGPYVVWARSPSLGSFYDNSPYWSFNHMVTQFTNAYRTYNGSYLTQTNGVTIGGQQYFVCGD